MKKSLFCASFFALFFTSCLKETLDDVDSIKGVKADPAWSFPLINATMGMDKLVSGATGAGQQVETDPSRRLVLKFSGVDSTRDREFLQLPPVNIAIEHGLPAPAIPVFIANGSFTAQFTDEEQLILTNNERVQRVVVKKGNIAATFTSEFEHDVKIKISYPGVIRNGVALVDSFEIPYTGTVPHNVSRPLVLDGYTIDLTKNGTTFNVLAYELEVTIIRNPANNITTAEKLKLNETINIESYARADGYFGQIEVLKYDEVTLLSLFDKKLEGNVFIREPVLRIRVENEIGMPITGKITDIFVESSSGIKLPVLIDAFKDTFNLNYSTVPGQQVPTEYVIDKNNSNIADVISSAPQKITYSVTFTSNYDNVVKDNVLTDRSNIKVRSTLELPFDLRILYYVLEETSSFNFEKSLGSYDTTNVNVQWAELTTETINELPLNCFTQVYFEDSVTNKRIDSLFKEPYQVTGANVDAQGIVISAGKELVTSYFDKARYDRVRAANRYRINVRLRTSENNGNTPFVTFYDYQKVRTKIGVKAKALAKITF